jgi:ATP-binding cassette subfamily F protein uup
MLEEALAAFDGTILAVSHDRWFLDRICDRIVAFEEGGVHCEPGNFSRYLETRRERHARYAPRDPGMSPNKSTPTAPAPRRKMNNREKQELEGMEATILQAENIASDLEVVLNDPDFHATRSEEVPALIARLEAQRLEIERLYARWEELSNL